MDAAPTEARTEPPIRHAAGDSLGAKITALCRNLYTSTCRLLVLIREFDENGYWQLAGHASCAHWLHFQCGIGLGAAREKVRVAHALAGLPKISDAFAQGALSYSKVRAVTRIADENNEEFLLRAARHGTAADVERLVSQSRNSAGDENARAQSRYRSRCVTTGRAFPRKRRGVSPATAPGSWWRRTTTASRWPSGDGRGRFRRRSGARCKFGTGIAGFRAARARVSMRTTSCTGRMGVKPVWTTLCCSAGITIGCCTKAVSVVNGCRAGGSFFGTLEARSCRLPAGSLFKSSVRR